MSYLEPGAVFLLNAPGDATRVWDQLSADVQQAIIETQAKVYVIDAYDVARDTGMGNRINTIMQVCFFAISGVLPRDEAITHIKGRHPKDLQQTWRRHRPGELRGSRRHTCASPSP